MRDDDGERSSLAERRGQDYAVYQPAEDSALLAGAVVEDLGGTALALVLDVGTGSGYVGARVADATGARVVGVDVNATACRRARDAGIEAVAGDLTSPFRTAAFDVVAFNPPYLPAVEEARWDDAFEVAVTGGATGREVIDRFVTDVGRVLTPDGAAYLLLSSLTGADAVIDRAAESGFGVTALQDASFPGETLTVLKLYR